MDEIKFCCPHCDQKIAVPLADAGRAATCPVCARALHIPVSNLGATMPAGAGSRPAPSVEAEVARWKTRLDKAREEIRCVLQERDTLQAAIAGQAGLPAQCAALKAEVARLGQALAAAQAERDTLAGDSARLFEDGKALRLQLDAARNSLDSERRKLREVGAHFAQSERERVELLQRIGRPPNAGPREPLNGEPA